MKFETNIFINCPFDKDYFPLLKPLLYVIKRIGFNPRISLERSDSGEVRLHKIQELIESSKYSIHDLSRSKAKKVGEYFRQNMPFELGLDLGCKNYKKGNKNKKILILEEEKYSVQKALSDLSFADCKCHEGKSIELIYAIRDWFAENGIKDVPSGSALWDDYNTFYADLYVEKLKIGFKPKDIDRITMTEFMRFIDENLK